MVIRTNNRLNVHPENVLDVDLWRIYFINVPNHRKILKNNAIKYVSMKGAIMYQKKNQITVIIITIKRYIHLLHECLVMAKVVVDILLTIHSL